MLFGALQLKNDVQQKTLQLADQEKLVASVEQNIQDSRKGKEDSVGQHSPRKHVAQEACYYTSSKLGGSRFILDKQILSHMFYIFKRHSEGGWSLQDDRAAKLAEMQQLEIDVRVSKQELAQYADNDPQKLESMSECTSSCVTRMFGIYTHCHSGTAIFHRDCQ